MPKQNELTSAVDVDYTHLRDLLVATQWKEADHETGTVMLKIARRVGVDLAKLSPGAR